MTTAERSQQRLSNPPPDWTDILERLRDKVQLALDHAGNTHQIEDLIDGVVEGVFQVWYHPRALIITELLEFPRAKACNFFIAAGDGDALEVIRPDVEKWAKNQGCDRVVLTGRDGWMRAMRTSGWRGNGAHMVKFLDARGLQ